MSEPVFPDYPTCGDCGGDTYSAPFVGGFYCPLCEKSTRITRAVPAAPIREEYYCGPCSEYYAEGDIFDAEGLSDLGDAVLSFNGTECPTCLETGRTVESMWEEQEEAKTASFHDGGSQTWAAIERDRGK